MHTPVYLEEAIAALELKQEGKYIDATLGEGGHLEQIAASGASVLGIDWDLQQVSKGVERFSRNPLVKIVRGNFADIENIARENGFLPATGILMDLGLSFEQFQQNGIGLSYKYHTEPLDMRLNESAEQTAADLLNRASEDELYDIFARNAEEVHAREVAKACVLKRKEYKFKVVGDFIILIDEVIPKNPQISYARLFQGLRIAVNDEFGSLKRGLAGALRTLAPGGRLAVITFHSVEDRMVKMFIRSESASIAKSYKVIKKNSMKFERSALLRVIIKK
ncbi:16S rRNA (cytosine(1402)-N(4))-methyltransferase RsmH [Candidatus Microgenomates bacterium]|nr:16S rRNA (cytosine(1402)-N(4))-methyltransferase RsmH [Candidatus Microgenomates bacterium]